MNLEKKLFMIWDTEESFWHIYDNIEDAVSSHGDGVEVYESVPRYLGTYKRQVSLVKLKRKSKGKKNE